MMKIFQAADLATLPADKSVVSTTKESPGRWFEVANLSPYAFELLDDGGAVRGLAGPFNYAAIPLMVTTENIVLHAVATQAAAPLPAASWAVYGGVTMRAALPEKLA